MKRTADFASAESKNWQSARLDSWNYREPSQGLEGVDKGRTFRYGARNCSLRRSQEMQVHRAKPTAKLFYRLLLTGLLCGCGQLALAQSPSASLQTFPLDSSTVSQVLRPASLGRPADAFHFRTPLMPGLLSGYTAPFVFEAQAFQRSSWSSSPGTIEKMESAFYCNDTPFVDQVRLPLATLWNGRVKLIGFESDITTANFVLGLPGQGSLHSLSAFGNAFIATHTPPSDQIAGIHVTLSLKPTDTDAGENSGRRGIEYLVRASRGFLPFLSAHSDSMTIPAR